MENILKKTINIKVAIGIFAAVFIGILLAFQIPVFAANTFPSPRQYDLVSINNVDGKGVNKHASLAGVSRDGSKVLFLSAATNLPDSGIVANATGGYLRDMSTSSVVRVDKSQSGTIADGSSNYFKLSETGRYVVFRSNATNLIDGTTYSAAWRIYIKDMQTGGIQVTNASVNSSDANYGYSYPLSISNDGRFVIIQTRVVNQFIPGTRAGSNGYYDVLRFDRGDNSWQLVNKPVDGILQNMYTFPASTNCDGSLIVFYTDATNMAPYFSGSGTHLYLADMRNGITITDLTPGTTAVSNSAKMSCNGRYITYGTNDKTLISPTPTGMSSTSWQAIRYDRITGERIYIGSNSNNTAFSASGFSSVTDKGDVVVLYPSGNVDVYNQPEYVYRFKHLSDNSGTLEEIQGNGGLASDSLSSAIVSADGSYVAASTPDAYALGLPVVYESGVDADHTYNVIRIKTGL
jgi:hypothetical protein